LVYYNETNKDKYMRITLNNDEIEAIRANTIPPTLLEKIDAEENKTTSPKLLKGAKNARLKRTKETYRKISEALNYLFMYEPDKKITVYSVAKQAGVSYNTINKNEKIKKSIEDMEAARTDKSDEIPL
jgi:hypothetical protein